MDLLTLAGFLLALCAVLVGAVLKGAAVGALLSAAAFMIVVVGTVAAILVQTPRETFHRALAMLPWIVRPPRFGGEETVARIVGWSRAARRKGLLGLDAEVAGVDDPFTRRGLELVVDGTDPALVKEVLQTEVDTLHTERHGDAKIFELMGGYAPTMGIVGTVIGLVVTLSNISDPASLAGAIAIAFLATLYGVGSANLLFLPIGVKLQGCADDEVSAKELLIEGILSIQSGDNPRIVEEKLVAFLTTSQRAEYRASQASDEDESMDLAA